MTTPYPPQQATNPSAAQFDAALAQNPQLAQDPSLAFPVATSALDQQSQTQVVNAAGGQYYASYLQNLPLGEQADAWSAMNQQQQQLAQAGGYTSALQQQNMQQVQDPNNHAGPSFLSRMTGGIKAVLSDTVGALGTATGDVLSALNKPLSEVQRGANAGILDLTDLMEGHGISPAEAWAQAGSAPMSKSSLDGLVAKYGQPMMDLVRASQMGKDPLAQQAALLAQAKTDPANTANYQDQANQVEQMYRSPEFKQALIEANNHLISPGRVVASWASNALSGVTGGKEDLYAHKWLYSMLSGPVDALFDFQADPLMFLSKAYEARNAIRFGLNIDENFGGAVKAAEGAAEGVATAVEGVAPEALAGAEAGAEGGPEGLLVGGALGIAGGTLDNLMKVIKGKAESAPGKAASFAVSPILGNAIAQGLTRGVDSAAITDMPGFNRRMGAMFSDPDVRNYFDGAGAHIANIVDQGADAAESVKALRRDYPLVVPYLDGMVHFTTPGAEMGVRSADDAHAFFNDVKGFQLLSQGAAASRIPLMAHRSELAQKIMDVIPRAGDVFDWMENGHKLTDDNMSDLKSVVDSFAAEQSPETRAAALANTDFAEPSTQAATRARAAQQLAMAQTGWRGQTALAMRAFSTKLPTESKEAQGMLDLRDFYGDGSATGATQNFVRTVRMFAPSWMADQVTAAFAAADMAGRKNIYSGMARLLSDASGFSKTEAGQKWLANFDRQVQNADVGDFSIGPVGRNADGSPVAHNINDARPYVPMIPVKDFIAQAAKHNVIAHSVSYTNKELVDSLVDKVWRPFVLLRPAFAFRSSIEEGLNHIFRVGMVDKLQGMLSRSALNEKSLIEKTRLGALADGAQQAYQDFDSKARDLYRLPEDSNVPVALRRMANKSGADSQELRSVALKHEALFTAAQNARNDAEAAPDSFDPDHSRFMKFMLSPITGSARLTTAIMRKLPVDVTIKGHQFQTTGARLRDLQDAHEAEGIRLKAALQDATTNRSNAEAAFQQKYGMSSAEMRARSTDETLTAPERRVATKEYNKFTRGETQLRENQVSAQLAVDRHPAMHPEMKTARDNMVQGWVDRSLANFIHFNGRLGLAYVERSSPRELQDLWELAQSQHGRDMVNHEVTEMAVRTARNASVDMGPVGKRAPYIRAAAGPFKAVETHGDLGAHAWSWALDKMSQDPLMVPAMLNLDDPIKAAQAVKDALQAHPEFRNEMKVLSTKSDDLYASQKVVEAQHHFGIGGNSDVPGELNRGLWEKMVTTDENGFRKLNPDAWHPQALNEYPDALRPHKVFGRDTILMEDNSKEGFLPRLVQEGFQRTGSLIAYMSRQDQMLQEYKNMRQQMRVWEEMHAEHLTNAFAQLRGGEYTTEDAERAREISNRMAIDYSVEQSWYRTAKFLDNPGTRSQAAVLLRNMAPFWRAQQGFLERVGRSFRYSPSMIAKLDQAADYTQKSPFMHKDADGKTRLYIPLSGAGQRMLSVVGGAFGMDLHELPVPNAISGDLLMSSPGFNVDFLKHPLTGPVVTLPLQAWTAMTHNTTLQSILEGAAGSASANNDTTQGILLDSLPAVVRPLAAFLVDNNHQKEVAAQQAMAFLAASGKALPPNATSKQKADFLKSVQAHALGWTLLKALTQPFVPMTEHDEGVVPEANSAAQAAGLRTVKDEFNQLVKDTGSYELAYQYWVQYHPHDIPFLTGQTVNQTEATIPATQEGFDWMNANQGLIKDYKLAAPFLIPQTGTKFSYQPYALAQQLGLQTTQTNEEFLNHLQTIDNLQTYYDARDGEKAALLNSSGGAANQIRQQFTEWSNAFKLFHPDAAAYIANGSVRDNERTQTIVEMKNMLKDPRTQDTPEARSMVQMLNLWTSYQVALQGVNSRGQGGTTQKAALTAQFDAAAKQMAVSDPTASMLYTKLFQHEETSNLLANGGL